MEQNEGKAAAAQGAFERFKVKLRSLSERRNDVFLDIIGRIDKRKVEEVRKELESSDGEKLASGHADK